jgi:hypothetical protein
LWENDGVPVASQQLLNVLSARTTIVTTTKVQRLSTVLEIEEKVMMTVTFKTENGESNRSLTVPKKLWDVLKRVCTFEPRYLLVGAMNDDSILSIKWPKNCNALQLWSRLCEWVSRVEKSFKAGDFAPIWETLLRCGEFRLDALFEDRGRIYMPACTQICKQAFECVLNVAMWQEKEYPLSLNNIQVMTGFNVLSVAIKFQNPIHIRWLASRSTETTLNDSDRNGGIACPVSPLLRAIGMYILCSTPELKERMASLQALIDGGAHENGEGLDLKPSLIASWLMNPKKPGVDFSRFARYMEKETRFILHHPWHNPWDNITVVRSILDNALAKQFYYRTWLSKVLLMCSPLIPPLASLVVLYACRVRT